MGFFSNWFRPEAERTQAHKEKHITTKKATFNDCEEVLYEYVKREFKQVQSMFNEGRPTRVISGTGPDYVYTGDNEDKITTLKQKEFTTHIGKIRNNAYKGHIIFHGGCLSCNTAIVENVGACYTCAYYNWDFRNYEDKKEKYSTCDLTNYQKGLK